MPDRLPELLRQRVLIEEHLAWLNRQIAAESPPAGRDVSNVSPRPSASAVAAGDTTGSRGDRPLPIGAALNDADTILSDYQQNPANLERGVKQGCLLYFAVAMGILVVAVFLLYLNTLRHPLSAAPRAPASASAPRGDSK